MVLAIGDIWRSWERSRGGGGVEKVKNPPTIIFLIIEVNRNCYVLCELLHYIVELLLCCYINPSLQQYTLLWLHKTQRYTVTEIRGYLKVVKYIMYLKPQGKMCCVAQ